MVMGEGKSKVEARPIGGISSIVSNLSGQDGFIHANLPRSELPGEAIACANLPCLADWTDSKSLEARYNTRFHNEEPGREGVVADHGKRFELQLTNFEDTEDSRGNTVGYNASTTIKEGGVAFHLEHAKEVDTTGKCDVGLLMASSPKEAWAAIKCSLSQTGPPMLDFRLKKLSEPATLSDLSFGSLRDSAAGTRNNDSTTVEVPFSTSHSLAHRVRACSKDGFMGLGLAHLVTNLRKAADLPCKSIARIRDLFKLPPAPNLTNLLSDYLDDSVGIYALQGQAACRARAELRQLS